MPSLRSRSTPVLGCVAAAIIAGLVWFGCGRDQGALTSPGVQRPSLSLDADVQQGLGPAVAAKHRHSARLFAIPGVVGTAVGLTADGRPGVKVFTRAAGVAGLPQSLDGIPVLVEVTGEFFALQGQGSGDPPPGRGGGGGGGTKIDPTSTFARPVPIGVSTGNEGQCSAGTISARVKDLAGKVYALSNNHVYALENTASIGSFVLQPGLFDTGCSLILADTIGRLSVFKTLSFSGACPATPTDTVDAAIARSSTALLGNATPSNGYGTPNHLTSGASVGQAVQKYGRTSSLTKGTVTAVNAMVSVGYSSGTACFDDQVIVQSRKAFIKPGDSGSLLVTNTTDAFPVGLLFAGTSSGQLAVANPIDLALAAFGVSVDGK